MLTATVQCLWLITIHPQCSKCSHCLRNIATGANKGLASQLLNHVTEPATMFVEPDLQSLMHL
jgi:hypothetical protein